MLQNLSQDCYAIINSMELDLLHIRDGTIQIYDRVRGEDVTQETLERTVEQLRQLRHAVGRLAEYAEKNVEALGKAASD